MTPFSCASCGPGSLTMTALCSCCSITMRAVRLGQRCSRTWSPPLLNTSWTWAFSLCCHSRTPMEDTSSVCGQVGAASLNNSAVFWCICLCIIIILIVSISRLQHFYVHNMGLILNNRSFIKGFDHDALSLHSVQGNGNLTIIHLWTMWGPFIWLWRSWSSLRKLRWTVSWSWPTTLAWACRRRPIQDRSSPRKLWASSRWETLPSNNQKSSEWIEQNYRCSDIMVSHRCISIHLYCFVINYDV